AAESVLVPLARAMAEAAAKGWRAAPLINGEERTGAGDPVLDPSDHRREIGRVVQASAADVETALAAAHRAQPGWDRTPAERRAAALERAALLYEERTAELMAL